MMSLSFIPKTLSAWAGTDPFAEWSSWFDRAMRPAFPALNMWEDAERLYVEAEIPGVKAEEVDISVLGDELRIEGSRAAESKPGASLHRHERPFGRFVRAIRLPLPIDPENVEASFRNGVLTIAMAKAEQARPRKIQVKSAE